MNQNLNFVIVDDKQVDIAQFEQALKVIENSHLIYKALSKEQLSQYLKSNHQKVDYLIVDLKFANDFKAGFRIINEVHQSYKKIKILICSEYPDRAYLQKIIFEESTYGFLEKGRESFVFDLKRAIQTIETGGFFWEIALRKNLTINGQMYDRKVSKRLKEEKYYSLPKSERIEKNPTDMRVTPAEIKKYRYEYVFQDEYDMSAQRWLIFKNVALGYNTEKISEILDTPMTTINAQKSKIREQLEIEGQGDVWFLIKALEFGLKEVIEFLETTVNISIVRH